MHNIFNLFYRFLYEDAETMSLMIKDVDVEDAGIYEIVASNDLGTDTGTMNLVVKSPPKIKKPKDYVSMADEVLKMCVDITGNPVPTTKFFKNGVHVVQDDRIKFNIVGETHYIEFHNCQLEDAGNYSVIATNDLSQQSEFWNLVVNSKPKVTKALGKEYVFGEKETIKLQLNVDGFPAPKVKWFKDGKEISPNDPRVKITNEGNLFQIEISGASRDDIGNYSVEFTNEHGTNRDETRVHIKCAPIFKKTLKETTFTENETNVEIFVEVEGYPK